jgi:hypothetical protein
VGGHAAVAEGAGDADLAEGDASLAAVMTATTAPTFATSPTWKLIEIDQRIEASIAAVHRATPSPQLSSERLIVSAIRAAFGSTISSRMSAAGRGMCGVVIRTGGPSRS